MEIAAALIVLPLYIVALNLICTEIHGVRDELQKLNNKLSSTNGKGKVELEFADGTKHEMEV